MLYSMAMFCYIMVLAAIIAIYICQNNRNTWSEPNNDEIYDNMHLHFYLYLQYMMYLLFQTKCAIKLVMLS